MNKVIIHKIGKFGRRILGIVIAASLSGSGAYGMKKEYENIRKYAEKSEYNSGLKPEYNVISKDSDKNAFVNNKLCSDIEKIYPNNIAMKGSEVSEYQGNGEENDDESSVVLSSYMDAVAHEKKYTKQLESTNKNLQNRLEDREFDIMSLKKEVQDAEKKFSALQNRHDKLQKEFTKIKEDAKNLDCIINELTKDQTEHSEYKDVTAKKIMELKEQNTNLSAKLYGQKRYENGLDEV